MVDSVLDQGVKESVGNENMKTVGGAASFYTAQGMADSLANQRRMNQLAEMEIADKVAHSKRMDVLAEGQVANAVRGMGELVNTTSPEEATAIVKEMQGGDLANKIAELSATHAQTQAQIGSLVALVQQLMKGAQTTLPETALTKPAQ